MPKRKVVLVFIVAVLLNYLWELAQAPLYVGLEAYNPRMFWHCFVASLGDGIMLLLIIAAGWLTFRQPDWFVRPGVRGYLLMMTTGVFLAVLVEWGAMHILDRWEYNPSMPTLPMFHIGLVPIAQMLILPPLIFRIVAKWSYNKRHKFDNR